MSATLSNSSRKSRDAIIHGHTQLQKTSSSQTRSLSGQALLTDMDNYRKTVAASPESARNFLISLGVMTKNGKVKKLICG